MNAAIRGGVVVFGRCAQAAYMRHQSTPCTVRLETNSWINEISRPAGCEIRI
jgi:hypothetical protein